LCPRFCPSRRARRRLAANGSNTRPPPPRRRVARLRRGTPASWSIPAFLDPVYNLSGAGAEISLVNECCVRRGRRPASAARDGDLELLPDHVPSLEHFFRKFFFFVKYHRGEAPQVGARLLDGLPVRVDPWQFLDEAGVAMLVLEEHGGECEF